MVQSKISGMKEIQTMAEQVINLASERYRRGAGRHPGREPIEVSETLRARLGTKSFAEAHALADRADDLASANILDMIDAEVRAMSGRVEMMLLNISDEKLEEVSALSIGRVSGNSTTTDEDIVDNLISDEVGRRSAERRQSEASRLTALDEVVRDAVTEAGFSIAAELLHLTDAELAQFSNRAVEQWPATNGMHQFIHDLICDEFARRAGGDAA